MSEWETIAPRSGERARFSGITVAWRKVSSARMCAVLTISKELAAEMGGKEPAKGEPKPRLLVQRDRVANRLRLTFSASPEAWAPHWKEGCASVAIPLDGVSSDKRAAQRVAHRMEGRATIVEMPDWARESASPAPRPAIPLVQPKAATPRNQQDPLTWQTADEIEEARQMLRGGKVGAKALAEYFGWPHDEAVKIAAALRAELQQAGKAA